MISVNNLKHHSREEWQKLIVDSSALVKSVLGVCNNATYLYMMEAYEAVQKHPKYKGRIKRLFEDAIKEWKRYEGNLLYADKNCFFRVEFMPEQVRKMYNKDLTNRDFFEYWQGFGGRGYMTTRPLITSLANKYRLSFEKHHILESDICAKVMASHTLAEVCKMIYGHVMDECTKSFGLPPDWVRKTYKPFSIDEASKAWKFAMLALEPRIGSETIPENEEKNISLGIVQIMDAWSEPSLLYDSMYEATDDFSDVFRNKLEVRKVKADISSVKADNEAVMNKRRINELKQKYNIA